GYMIRSSQTRVMYKEVDFPAHSVRPLQRGDITICNTSAGQYKGELQIVLKDRPNDGSFNVVGRIAEDSLALIDHLKPWQGFKLQ
ncbi:phospho-sugar glycosidase domain-containing protein, partial [Streptococcus alactolyticus]